MSLSLGWRHHDFLALKLAGHAGGPVLENAIDDATLADAVESAMDWSYAYRRSL